VLFLTQRGANIGTSTQTCHIAVHAELPPNKPFETFRCYRDDITGWIVKFCAEKDLEQAQGNLQCFQKIFYPFDYLEGLTRQDV